MAEGSRTFFEPASRHETLCDLSRSTQGPPYATGEHIHEDAVEPRDRCIVSSELSLLFLQQLDGSRKLLLSGAHLVLEFAKRFAGELVSSLRSLLIHLHLER